jgi:hypothetical protein
MRMERSTTMPVKRNANQIKRSSHIALGMLIGMIIGLALDNIAVGLVLGINFGFALEKHYR